MGIILAFVIRLMIYRAAFFSKIEVSGLRLRPFQFIPPIVALIAMGASAFFIEAEFAVRLYPVAISYTFAAVFLWSVLFPPTIVEMIARLKEPDLGQSGILYTRNVTILWIVFFLFNGSVAYWTVCFGSLEQWTLYNGLISYCFIGLLFSMEMIVRRFMKSRNR
ncbi:hypothetical protein [Sneathiella glossodoripedis]|uniref:COG4648 family protein n=1 Tax=Sneathiella glossodoripedis TaxID=418853 RepID=UPI0011DD7E4B|nr:hypothetical protein [Sneathiella glossodoripedis]